MINAQNAGLSRQLKLNEGNAHGSDIPIRQRTSKVVYEQRSDGLIIATPTGSTAYSLSCGGPIMKPDVEAFLLVPIAPHTLNDRPMVLPSSSEIILQLNENQTDMVGIDIDGDTMSELKPGQELLIKKAEKTVSLLHPENYDYFDNLKSKLLWGVDNRND